MTTATMHSPLAKQNQPSASTGSGVNTKQQLEEYMDMTESSKALSGNSKEQFEEYMKMNDNNKGMRTNVEQGLEEYMQMTEDSKKIQKDGPMFVDLHLETVQGYEVPVNCKKT